MSSLRHIDRNEITAPLAVPIEPGQEFKEVLSVIHYGPDSGVIDVIDENGDVVTAEIDLVDDAAADREAREAGEEVETSEQRYRRVARATGLFHSDEVILSFAERNPELVELDTDDETLTKLIRQAAIKERTDRTGDAWAR